MKKIVFSALQLISAVLVFGVFILTFEASGQSLSGIISGEVRDVVTKQPLPGANIIIVGTQFGAASDLNGYYVFKNVVPGTYTLKASMIGYESSLYAQLSVHPNRNHSVHFELSPGVLTIEEVLVSSDYFSKPAESPVSFRTLSPDEIRKSPGSAEDIFRVMQSLPGVATAGAKSAQLIVRGGSPDENLTLLDNIEVYNPIHFARTGESMGIISIVNPALLQKVDFLTGGFPVKYGDKMSSVFDMTLRDGNKETFNSDANLNIAGFGIMMDGPITDKSTLVLSLRRGFFDLITSVFNRPVAPSYYDAVGKITYDVNSKNRISLVGFYYLDQIERTGSTKADNSNWNRYDYVTRDDYGAAAGLTWRSLISQNAFSLVTASYTSNGWFTRQGTQAEPTLMGEDIHENELSLKSEFNYQLPPRVNFKIGAQYKIIDAGNESWSPEYTTRNGMVVPASTISYHPELTSKIGVFLQSSILLTEPLTVSAGLRYDYFLLTKGEYLSPRVSLSYNFSKATIMNIAWGKYYQSPASYQIAPDSRNLTLHNEYATHYIAGIEQHFGSDTKASIELYYKNLSHLFVDPDSTNLLLNSGSGYAQGIEFALQKKFTNGFVGSASYSYSLSKRKDDEVSMQYDYEYERPHILNLLFGIEIGSDWQIGAKFQYASGNPYTPPIGVTERNNSFYIIEGETNSARYPDYHKLDVRIDKQFVFNSWSFAVYLDLWNIYNQNNVSAYSFKAEANGDVITTARYDFGIMPILGFTARF